ncbi:MAG: hypothetical protein ABSF91_00475 [Bacteroidota bacterium]
MRQILSVVLTTCLLISCNNNGTGPQYFDVQLTADDVGVTEAWLRLQIAPSVHHNALRLTLDGSSVLTAQYLGLDTVVFVNSLLPKHSYTFKAYTLSDSVTNDSSNAFTVATMDTTSHNITWQIDTLGYGNAGVLYDVFIFSDTLVYAVGEMYLADSTGQFNTMPYGIAKWDGKKWGLSRVYGMGPEGGSYASDLVPEGVFVSSPNDIWFASGGTFHWDGQSNNATPYWINPFPGNPNPIWVQGQYATRLYATSVTNLWTVGPAGGLARFNGLAWEKVESGTTTDIDDIWGAKDPQNGTTNILCVVSSKYSIGDKRILSIDSSGSISSLPWTPPHRINTVWFKTFKKIFVGGGGLYVGTDNVWKEVLDLPPYFSTRIRGTAINDVFVVGSFGLCGHFNGMTWRNYPEAALPEGEYEGLSVNPHMVIAVGFSGGQAVVLRGYRK